MKLCKDCKWCEFSPENNGYKSLCINPEINIFKSPVTGENYKSCCVKNREYNYKLALAGIDCPPICNTDIHFEEKESE